MKKALIAISSRISPFLRGVGGCIYNVYTTCISYTYCIEGGG